MSQGGTNLLAFILMPFAKEFERVYEGLIGPALAEAGYEVRRADSTLDQQNIMRTIVENIATADLIVAEVTTVNANVFYELGIAHALGKPVVMVAQGLEGIPFDLRSYRTILYSIEFDKVEDFQTSLRDVARESRENAVNFGNPVTDFAPRSIRTPSDKVGVPSSQEETVPEEPEEEEPEEDFGVLDFVNTAKTSLERIMTLSEDLTATVNDFAVKVAARGAEAEVAQQSNAPGSSVRMMRIVKGMASEMNEFSDTVAVDLPDFREAWERFEDSFTNILFQVRLETREDREAAVALQGQMQMLREAIGEALAGIEEARGAFGELRGISKDLNIAVRRVEKTISRVSEEYSKGDSILVRTSNLLDQALSGS